MKDRIEFSSYEFDDVLGMSKAEWREKIAADTEAFLQAGGVIEELPYNPLAEIAARVGRWSPLGTEELDDLVEDTYVS